MGHQVGGKRLYPLRHLAGPEVIFLECGSDPVAPQAGDATQSTECLLSVQEAQDSSPSTAKKKNPDLVMMYTRSPSSGKTEARGPAVPMVVIVT